MLSASESKDERAGSFKALLTVFWITAAIFLFLIASIFIQIWIPIAAKNRIMFLNFFLPGIAALSLLGIVLIVLAVRSKILKGLRKGLILVGASAVGMPVSALLHNVLYALIIAWFGNDFLQKLGGYEGGDEAFFFILAVFVFPAIFVLSLAYCAYVCIKAKGDISA
jgi:cytochrome b561